MLEENMSSTQRVLVYLATTGELHSTKVLPCDSRVADLRKELEEDQNHINILLSGDRALTNEEQLPCGTEVSVQLLRQSVLGRWVRRTGVQPKEPKDSEVHDYKEEILLLRKDGQGRFSMKHTWVTNADSYGSDQRMVGCSPETIKKDSEGLGGFLESSEEGAPWEWQVLGEPAEPSICIKGAGWRATGIIEDDDIVAHGSHRGIESFDVPLQELLKTWDFVPVT